MSRFGEINDQCPLILALMLKFKVRTSGFILEFSIDIRFI